MIAVRRGDEESPQAEQTAVEHRLRMHRSPG
jgi:hypothetical protein